MLSKQAFLGPRLQTQRLNLCLSSPHTPAKAQTKKKKQINNYTLQTVNKERKREKIQARSEE
jgi:hypothetical protein